MTGTDYANMLRQLEDGTLRPERFSHADHVGVTFEALRCYEFFEATWRVAHGIRALTERAGVSDKFNATITFAFICLIGERMAARDWPDFGAFIDENPDLTNAQALKVLYSQERLNSALARATALLPDRLPDRPGAHSPDDPASASLAA